MPGALIDFHCHLDLYPDFERQVAECDRQRIFTLAMTTLPAAWPRNRDLAASTKHVRAALGLHPQVVAERWRDIDAWERCLPQARYVGEVGLDAGPRHYASLARQMDVFGRVLKACASEGGKVLSVHSVRAASQVLNMVEEFLPPDRGIVCLHWFTGNAAEARRAVDLGCYFSVNSEMLRKERGIRLIRSLPPNRVLTETDGPFTNSDGRPSVPADARKVLAELATAGGVSVDDMSKVLLQNLKTLANGMRSTVANYKEQSTLPGACDLR